jgi:hypothetical protein
MEGEMKETEILSMLRKTLGILGSVADNAELPALAFLIGMADAGGRSNGGQHQT